ncbi:TetR/AcrR family transcriptional regulator [Aquibacillus salsiterrae]|uniref:TetR/AcrR family transcriptional regulator n=1 Tax=Aquibacillus salsiterrae TaxID=2950439 RepID=A0A9X3WJ56_9BACI|nr:TetR/AcrR family transcriptional regulator [Aquibacillus salsiterrae]MDC3418324.1 TetR/AcrR family transcriptional regulator [Aquibacillus salsiterrae]
MASKREEIIYKVSSLIHSQGYENTKLSEILQVTGIGKGQFYHYFSSKRELADAVIDYLIAIMEEALFENILDQPISPKEKLNQMLDEICDMQMENQAKRGCPIGNLAIETSEHDPMFREKISSFFDRWEHKVKQTIDELQQEGMLGQNIDTTKHARSMVAMIEGAILRMKNKQDIQVLRDITDVIRHEYNLKEV